MVGQTDAQGRDTIDYGWSQNRYVYPEDIEATIYSALGIDWTTVRHDDPLGRGFEYVPTDGRVPLHAGSRTLGIAGRTGLAGLSTLLDTRFARPDYSAGATAGGAFPRAWT